jgi:hypothetical protein
MKKDDEPPNESAAAMREFHDALADYDASTAQLKASMDRVNSLLNQLPDPPEPLRPVHEQIQPVHEEMQTVTQTAVDHANRGSELGGKLVGLLGLFLGGFAAADPHYPQPRDDTKFI